MESSFELLSAWPMSTALDSKDMATKHFWIGTIGILIYVTSMWVTGVTQGLMWRAVNNQGDLMYSFIETVHQLHPYYVLRAFGGFIYLVGVIMMGYNLMMTAKQGRVTPTPINPTADEEE